MNLFTKLFRKRAAVSCCCDCRADGCCACVCDACECGPGGRRPAADAGSCCGADCCAK